MATKNIVPNADGEGSLGTSAKKWGNIYADEINLGSDGSLASSIVAADNRRAFAGGVALDASKCFTRSFAAPKHAISVGCFFKHNSQALASLITQDNTNGQRHFNFRISPESGSFQFILFDSGISTDFTSYTSNNTILPNIGYCAVATYDGSSVKIYLNGEEVPITASNTGSGFSNFGTTSEIVSFGSNSSGTLNFTGYLRDGFIFNRALSSTEAAELSEIGIGAWLAKYPEDQWAGSAALTSGTLEAGQRYRIATFVTGDDFTNVGAGSNATGVEFVATGTTPTTWTNGSSILPIGTLAAYPMDEGIGRQLRDLSGRYDALLSTTGYQHLQPKTEGFVRVKGFDASAAGSYMLEAGDIIPADSVVTKLVSENRFVDLTNAEQDLADRRIELDASGADLNINRSDGTTDQTLGTVTTPTSASDIDAQIHYEQIIR